MLRFLQREVDHDEDRKDRAWDLLRGARAQIPRGWRALRQVGSRGRKDSKDEIPGRTGISTAASSESISACAAAARGLIWGKARSTRHRCHRYINPPASPVSVHSWLNSEYDSDDELPLQVQVPSAGLGSGSV